MLYEMQHVNPFTRALRSLRCPGKKNCFSVKLGYFILPQVLHQVLCKNDQKTAVMFSTINPMYPLSDKMSQNTTILLLFNLIHMYSTDYMYPCPMVLNFSLPFGWFLIYYTIENHGSTHIPILR